MASMEKDSVSGQMTTGHEWDGIKELNTPLPKWWVYVFWACVLWAIGYWIAMPAWPTPTGYTQGMLNYSSRANVAEDLKAQQASRAQWMAKLQNASPEDIVKDKALLNFAQSAGKALFGENCSACHGAGGVGVPGAYPRLADDEWIWGGTLADIEQTIKFGVRNAHPDSRQSEMLPFGTGDALSADQVSQLADYVVSLSAKTPAAGSPGEALFAERCSACHQEGGVGMKDLGAPALNNNIWLYKGGKEGVIAQMTKPKHGSMPAWTERLDAGTIKILAVYVHSLGGGK
ncbi:Cbb3-type cytochrome c oxidase subunit FixP [Magnetospirillum sp. LM-5]|uniref:cytochrome-c oxidase, cbb3-type subunit III n=1 Tax=Magnetospirillum sp. LM-5 TaxID=2681466 RepID=UPI00137CC49D|nr:cytochrome-c oxidase, cbb3-type subunit III [Magnetospirillum sp. LM-5]CAA7619315.1 Cbb3-type cytochrome c oxidase subunit FixP [Magnetospirillum sp. LM-5]